MPLLKAQTPLTLDPKASDSTYADFERARAEGWYALEAICIDAGSRKSCAFSINESLGRAKEMGEASADYENEIAFIEPRAAIQALRMSLRAFIAVDEMMRLPMESQPRRTTEMAMKAALLKLGNALITIEAPN